MNYGIRYHRILRMRDGVQGTAMIGVGADDIVWMEPYELDVDVGEFRRKAKGLGNVPLVLEDSVLRKTFVNARAVAETMLTPEGRERMLGLIDELLVDLKATQLRHDTVRKN